MLEKRNILEGIFEYKLDSKCRVAVPSEWRNSLKHTKLRFLQSSSYGLPVLCVLSDEEHSKMLEEIDSRNAWSPMKKKRARAKLFSSCLKADISSQGKILIPKAWCEKFDIFSGEKVFLLGRGGYFEVVGSENYRELEKRETDYLAELNEELEFF